MNYLSTEDYIDKILFLGLSQSGKTSIIQVVFEGILPESTLKNQATGRIKKKKIDFSGKIVSVFEVGGQIPFLDESLSKFKESVYSNVKNFVFVVDSSQRHQFLNALVYYNQACLLVREYNKEANIFIFAHKIDLVAEEEKSEILNEIESVFNVGHTFNSVMFTTSIYDETIYEALSSIEV